MRCRNNENVHGDRQVGPTWFASGSNVIIFARLRPLSLEQATRDLCETRSAQGKRLYKTLIDASPKSKSR